MDTTKAGAAGPTTRRLDQGGDDHANGYATIQIDIRLATTRGSTVCAAPRRCA